MSILKTLVNKLFSQKINFGELCDDTYLRQLADDFEAGKTSWVFAADMAEYFRFVDRHNITQNMGSGEWMTVKIDPRINARLIGALNSKEHYTTKEGIDWNDVSKHIGPAGVNGLVVFYGNDVYKATYHYTGMESFLRFQLPDGTAKNYEFGYGDQPAPNPSGMKKVL